MMLVMDTMVKARLNSVGGNRMTREEVGNSYVAEIVRETLDRPQSEANHIGVSHTSSMTNLHLSGSQSLLQRRSSKPYICHPHCNNSCDHYPERLDHISTRVSELRLSSPRNVLRKCWRCVATRKRLFRYRFLQKGA